MESEKATVAVLQIMGYGNQMNEETDGYSKLCDSAMRISACTSPFYRNDLPTLKLRRIFSGGIPPGSDSPLSEAAFMAQQFKGAHAFNPDLDFLEEESLTTRNNVLRAIPIIQKIANEEGGRIGGITISVCCDELRAPRIKWLYQSYGGISIYTYQYPFTRTFWENFREFISFHGVEKTNRYFPGLAEFLEPIRRPTMFRKSP